MKRILKNKKGVAILDNIGQLIQGILQIVPKPILLILFLFVIVSVSYVLSILFNSFGIYCNSANEPVKLNANLLSGVSLITQIPDLEEIGREAVEGNVKSCRKQFNTQDAYFYIPSTNTTKNITTNLWYYEGTYCSQCTTGILKKTNGQETINQEYCTDRAYPTPTENKTWWQKTVCSSENSIFGSCEPPKGYYFDQNVGYYVCNSQDCTGKTIADKWDEKLAENGATLLYASTEDNLKAVNSIGITCTELKPRLALWGVDLFRYEYIFLLIIIVILIWIWMNLT